MKPITMIDTAARFARRRLAPTATHVPGVVLTIYREAAGVTLSDVASALDISKQRVSEMEKRDAVLLDWAGRYRAAVDILAGES